MIWSFATLDLLTSTLHRLTIQIDHDHAAVVRFPLERFDFTFQPLVDAKVFRELVTDTIWTAVDRVVTPSMQLAGVPVPSTFHT